MKTAPRRLSREIGSDPLGCALADVHPAQAVGAALRSVRDAMMPWRVGDYPNFVEEPTDASGFFDAATWERLRRVKSRYDPSDLFRGNHHVPPAGPG